jgi:hypothetical protein
MAKKNLEMLMQEGLATLSGEVLTLSSNLTVQDVVTLTNEQPDIDITRIIINSPSVYIISNADISLKEIIVKSSYAELYLKNISNDCKIVVKEKAKLGLLTNADKNNRLSLEDPIELGSTQGE